MPDTSAGTHALHLRTIHFALVVTCSVVLVALSLSGTEDAKQALEELDSIMVSWGRQPWDDAIVRSIEKKKPKSAKGWAENVVHYIYKYKKYDCWKEGGSIIESFLEEHCDDFFEKNKDRTAPLKVGFPSHAWFPIGRNGEKERRSLCYNGVNGHSNVKRLPAKLKILSLYDIISYWEYVSRILYIADLAINKAIKPTNISALHSLFGYDPENGAIRYYFDRPSYVSSDARDVEYAYSIDFNLCRRGEKIDFRISSAYYDYFWSFEVIGERVEYEYIRGRPFILPLFDSPPPDKDFNKAFPALSQYSEAFGDMSLEGVRKVLELDAKRSESKMDVLGAKVPIGEVIFWGILVIVVQQAYFLLHLRQQWRFPHRPTAPWIGLYEDPWSRRARWLTLVGFPVATCLLLGAVRPLYPAFLNQHYFSGIAMAPALSGALVFGFVLAFCSVLIAWETARGLGRLDNLPAEETEPDSRSA